MIEVVKSHNKQLSDKFQELVGKYSELIIILDCFQIDGLKELIEGAKEEFQWMLEYMPSDTSIEVNYLKELKSTLEAISDYGLKVWIVKLSKSF